MLRHCAVIETVQDFTRSRRKVGRRPCGLTSSSNERSAALSLSLCVCVRARAGLIRVRGNLSADDSRVAQTPPRLREQAGFKARRAGLA